MILSDRNILSAMGNESLKIEPFHRTNLQPASLDLVLGDEAKRLQYNDGDGAGNLCIDPKRKAVYRHEVLRGRGDDQFFHLAPGDVMLGTSVERFTFGPAIVGRLEGKSSLARLGLLVHSTAGFFDPGFEGEATFELINMARWPIKLYPGMKIAQMSFHQLSSPAMSPYGSEGIGSKYVGQEGPTESRMHLNFGAGIDGGLAHD